MILKSLEAAFLARIDWNVNALKSLNCNAFFDSNKFLLCATAFICDTLSFDTATFFLNVNADELLAGFLAARWSWLTTTVLGRRDHRTAKCDAHDGRENELEHGNLICFETL